MRTTLMRMPARTLLLVLLVASASRVAPAQAVMPDTGTRVRVFFNEGRDYFVGWLLPSSADSLFLEGRAGDTLAVARTNISKLQLSSGGSRVGSTVAGMTIGLVGGAVIGYGFGQIVLTRGDAMVGGGVIGAPIGGVIGIIVGGVVGSNLGGEWHDVTIAPILGARGGGARIALRF